MLQQLFKKCCRKFARILLGIPSEFFHEFWFFSRSSAKVLQAFLQQFRKHFYYSRIIFFRKTARIFPNNTAEHFPKFLGKFYRNILLVFLSATWIMNIFIQNFRNSARISLTQLQEFLQLLDRKHIFIIFLEIMQEFSEPISLWTLEEIPWRFY